jgi:adenine-specific DNA-methyltransferase
MASLAEREGLRGQVQCIYVDPPYGIKFNSNFQWSTTSRDVKDGKRDDMTREPEQVRAFRDTWKDGIHSYLTYLRDRLTVARDLLHESGSIFVQIGDENVHRVRALMDEVFGEDNFLGLIQVQKTGSQASNFLAATVDFLIWYAKDKSKAKYRQLYNERQPGHVSSDRYDQIEAPDGSERRLSRDELQRVGQDIVGRIFQHTSLISSGQSSTEQVFRFFGRKFEASKNNHWKTTVRGLEQLGRVGRVAEGRTTVRYKRYLDDFAVIPITDRWDSMQIGTELLYVVQTSASVVARCILMTTDPGDLVLDPTCGSGTTATVAERWGRRWITVDTSRVAIALARSRLMGARYPWYLLADSPEGQAKEGELTRTPPKSAPTHGSIRQGFVYDRVPHITLKSIANNAEIDVIWERMQPAVEDAIAALNTALRGHTTQFKVETGGRKGAKIDFTATGQVTLPSGELAPANGFMEWEIPREAPADWPQLAKAALERFWEARIARQKEIDASIAAKAEFEYLYDKPIPDKTRIRVAGPFTVESLSPHRTLAVDWDDELIDAGTAAEGKRQAERDGTDDFAHMILENLKAAGVQQAAKEDRITFTALVGWPGRYICAEGTFMEGEVPSAAPASSSAPNSAPSAAPTWSRPRARRRCRVRHADQLRLQLRRPFHRVRQAGPRAGAEGPHEPRPAHGRRPEEHRCGQPVRGLRRARHRDRGCRRR